MDAEALLTLFVVFGLVGVFVLWGGGPASGGGANVNPPPTGPRPPPPPNPPPVGGYQPKPTWRKVKRPPRRP